MTKNNNWNIETKLVHSGTIRSNFGETAEAIFLNSGFCYDSAETAESRFNGQAPGYVYSRYLNPSLRMLEEKLIAIEEGAEEACVMASGMAAVFASIMCQVKTGDHVIANKVIFGSCYHILAKILPNYGIEVSFVNGPDKSQWEKAIKKNTKVVFIETPANPTLELTDISYIAELCKKNSIFLIVDNIFSTSLVQSPIALGANAVVYSTTKHMDGGGKTLGGAVLGSAQFIKDILLPFHRHTGPALSPFNAWVVLKSLETFSLRMERHCSNAAQIADFLSQESKVNRVLYPHHKSHPQYEIGKKQMKNGGPMVAFELKGGKKEAFSFMNKLCIILISNNLGDAKSLITHPATTTHSNMTRDEQEAIGITEGLLRFSVGIENVNDLIVDLKEALKV